VAARGGAADMPSGSTIDPSNVLTPGERSMNTRSFALAGALLLATATGALAQSHQGGYLGLNPGANVQVSHGLGITQGSGQGGYLGENPGANLTSSGAAAPVHGSGEGGYLGIIPGSTSVVSPRN
jgi:hypothetical protein